MAENSKTAEEFISLHSIYCDCERCKPIPCFVCVTQDICRDRRECVQKDAWGAGAAAGGESRA